MNEDPNDESKDFFPLLAAYVAFQIIVGYILPGIFVSTSPSLKEYFSNLMNKVIETPKTFESGLKNVFLRQNRIGNLDLNHEVSQTA